MTPDTEPRERRLPPVSEIAVAAMVLVIIGGIYMAANLPGSISLVPAAILLGAAVVLLVIDVVVLARIRPFAWKIFFRVAGWALVAYLVIAGMIGYAFIYDGTRGGALALLVGMLAVFAVVVPVVLGFTVARYQTPDGTPAPTPTAPGHPITRSAR
jgi:hypothetical protein